MSTSGGHGRPVVCVFGANEAAEGEADFRRAYTAGRILAQRGYVVANGGYGGTMAASARGAKEAGGHAIGVTCRVWKASANPFIDEIIATGSLLERMAALIALGSGGYVVLPGATGTLAELAETWEQMCKGLLPRRPLVCVGRFWQPLVEMMAAARPASRSYLSLVDEAEGIESFFPPAAGLK